jgi:potassium channel LctB
MWGLVKLGRVSATVLTALWLLSAKALEDFSHQPAGPLRDYGSSAIGVIDGVALVFLVVALLRRLLEIINGRRSATLKDFALIGFAYIFVICAFGTVFLAADNFGGESFVYSNTFREQVKLFDFLYLSGITIATVGYGDIVPRTLPTKLLVVLEAITGLWLTVIVLGVFIGSLLGRQQQDRQAKFFTGFQSIYFEALTDHQAAVNSLGELPASAHEELKRSLLGTIASLVKLQYEPSPTARVNANWMRFYYGAEAPESALLLAREFSASPFRSPAAAMRSVWGILVIEDWDERPPQMPGKGELALPVYDPGDPDHAGGQLPGAPQAAVSHTGYVIVSDSSRVSLDNQDEAVRSRLERYFAESAPDLRSFASVRIDVEGELFGVINVQSNETDLCGTSPEVHALLVDMIRPFATYLLQVELDRESREEGPKR